MIISGLSRLQLPATIKTGTSSLYQYGKPSSSDIFPNPILTIKNVVSLL